MAKEMHEDQNAEKIDLNAQMSTSSLNTNQVNYWNFVQFEKCIGLSHVRKWDEKEVRNKFRYL